MRINLKLVPLKMVIFFLYAGMGCLMPFLTIHMYHIGLTHEEVTWINTVLPLTVLLGPPLAGCLADKFGHYRLITMAAMVLAGLFHTALLFIPERSPTFPPSVQLICGEYGSSLVVQSCSGHCPYIDEGAIAHLRLSNCRQECNIDRASCTGLAVNHTKISIVRTELSVAEQPTPRICLQNDTDFNCHNFEYSTYIDFSTAFDKVPSYKERYFTEFDECCEFSVDDYMLGGGVANNVTCLPDEGCHIVCKIEENPEDQDYVLQKSVCTSDGSNPMSTFWLYFFVRSLADMFPAILIALLDAVVLTMVAQHGGDYGRQKMFGLFAIGFSAPIVGWLMDKNILTHGEYQYAPVFYVFDILMLVTAVITFMLPFKVDVHRTSMLKNFGKLLRTIELNCLYLIVILLGAFWGFLETFLYVYMLQELSATNLLLGLTITVGLLPSVPFLYNSDVIVRYCGHHYLLMLAFVAYCIRFAGLSYLTNPYWVLPLELLELFTLNLMQVSAATLTYKIAPKALLATAQGLVWMAHFDIGRSLGTIVGGYIIKDSGTVFAFKVGSVICAFCAAIYLAIHQYAREYKKRKCIISSRDKRNENGTVFNSSYAPLPMEEKA